MTPVKKRRAPRSTRPVSQGPSRRSARLLSLGETEKEQAVPRSREGEAGEAQVDEVQVAELGVGPGGDEVGGNPGEQLNVEVFEEDMQCEICQVQFEKRGNFNRHNLRFHSEKDGGWSCVKTSFCSAKFATRYEMLVHKDFCNFRCPNCDWSTDRSDRVEGHRRKCT